VLRRPSVKSVQNDSPRKRQKRHYGQKERHIILFTHPGFRNSCWDIFLSTEQSHSKIKLENFINVLEKVYNKKRAVLTERNEVN
jgi:hypothetical protein